MSSPPRVSDASATSTFAGGWRLQHTFAQLPRRFHVAVAPTPVTAPQLVVLNRPLAESLGLSAGALAGDEATRWLGGNGLPPGASPLAQAYSGHQYGHFTTLGDGRAILLGEQITPAEERFDIQLKGSGPTPFSRNGDGRAAMGPMLREYIISEAMHALGIRTTRSLAVVATGEDVFRQEGPLPGAVLSRVAASHIRVGTFEWAADQGDENDLRALVNYTVGRHYPERVNAENLPLALLTEVIERQAALIAQWMHVGFVHGVMNTDNMAVSGETIDYGPCAFLDVYDPATVFSSIDRRGRYAYGNQPTIAQWNLTRFAEALLPVLHLEKAAAIALAKTAIAEFPDHFQRHWIAGMRRKLGLFNAEPDDEALAKEMLAWMQATRADYTNTFAALAQPVGSSSGLSDDAGFTAWHARWEERLMRQPQSAAESLALRRASNPAFIPRNHLVEAALAAAQNGDLTVLEKLLAVLATPYDHARSEPDYRESAPAGAGAYRTFCGT